MENTPPLNAAEDFLTSEIAKRATVKPKIIIYRNLWTPQELENIKTEGKLTVDLDSTCFDFEAGGQVIARGVIKIKNKNRIFKITELCDSFDNRKQEM